MCLFIYIYLYIYICITSKHYFPLLHARALVPSHTPFLCLHSLSSAHTNTNKSTIISPSPDLMSVFEQVSFVSTGGGASLELLEGKVILSLPLCLSLSLLHPRALSLMMSAGGGASVERLEGKEVICLSLIISPSPFSRSLPLSCALSFAPSRALSIFRSIALSLSLFSCQTSGGASFELLEDRVVTFLSLACSRACSLSLTPLSLSYSLSLPPSLFVLPGGGASLELPEGKVLCVCICTLLRFCVCVYQCIWTIWVRLLSSSRATYCLCVSVYLYRIEVLCLCVSMYLYCDEVRLLSSSRASSFVSVCMRWLL